MKSTAVRPQRNRPLPDLYQVLHCPKPNQIGLHVGHTFDARAAAQHWVRNHSTAGIANPIAAAEVANRASLIAWELMDNAHQHTYSGFPGQQLTLLLERSSYQLLIMVTDAGPIPGTTKLSFPEQKKSGGGLGRVASLSFYWEWDGCAGLPVTVKARIDIP